MRKSAPAAAIFLFAVALVAHAAELPRRITVFAGDYNRRDTVVRFTLPADARPFHQLQDERGNLIPIQTDNETQACFVEKDLKRGAVKTYLN